MVIVAGQDDKADDVGHVMQLKDNEEGCASGCTLDESRTSEAEHLDGKRTRGKIVPQLMG